MTGSVRRAFASSLAVLLIAGCQTAPPSPSVSQPGSVAPAVYDLGRDFSLTANPNGPWHYGYTRGIKLIRADFLPMTVAQPGEPPGFWHPGAGQPGYYPYIAANTGQETSGDQTGSWVVRPGEAALEASPTGQYAAIEFTVPSDGLYAIAADFTGIHRGQSTTDVHVQLGDDSLFSAEIEGYGRSASFRVTRELRASDVLTFAVGFGANRTHFNDTTGLIVTITRQG